MTSGGSRKDERTANDAGPIHHFHHRLHMRTTLIPLLAAAVCLLLPSCLIGSESSSKHTGVSVSPDTFSKIEPGADRDYVLGLLGPPTDKVHLDSGAQIWKWQYKVTTTDKGWVFLVLTKESTEITEGTAYVDFDAEGLVTKTWRD